MWAYRNIMTFNYVTGYEMICCDIILKTRKNVTFSNYILHN